MYFTNYRQISSECLHYPYRCERNDVTLAFLKTLKKYFKNENNVPLKDTGKNLIYQVFAELFYHCLAFHKNFILSKVRTKTHTTLRFFER